MKSSPVYAAIAFLALTLAPAWAQDAVDSHTVIRSDTRLVLVDSVVTDKKGNYVHDLTQKDFKVWEDGKEQAISSFSFEADGTAPSNDRNHYIVLFFDNSTVGPAEQHYAREAAAKFIDGNSGKHRYMAVAEFGGALKISQNFTENVDRLKQVVSGVKFSSVAPNGDPAPGGGPSLNVSFTNFSTRSVLIALRQIAKGMANVPGRKTLIFLSAGFPLNDENLSEMTATIEACNHSNVAVYPIDVRGLVAPLGRLTAPALPEALPSLAAGMVPGFPFPQALSMIGTLAFFQARGGAPAPVGGGGGGGARAPSSPGVGSPGGTSGGRAPSGPGVGSPGGTSGGRIGGTNPVGGTGGRPGNGGGGVTNPVNNNMRYPPGMNPNNQIRQIIPPILNSVTANHQSLYALANGTGGFVIVNTNDLLGGLEKIGKEQNEYYVVGYTPNKEFEPGSCHTIKVKVDRGGTSVRARTGYCDVKSREVLAGTTTERELEARVNAKATPTVGASMLTPFFYTSSNTARVDVAMEIPGSSIVFKKEKGKFHGAMNVLGIAYLPDGGVAARFSDSVKLEFEDKKEMEAFGEHLYHYEKQFEMASGKYNLKVAFSSGADGFGKLEIPLTIEGYDSAKFGLSGLALSKHANPSNQADIGRDAALLEDRVPFIVSGVQITPAGTNHFRKTDPAFLYAEIYEPGLLTAPDPNNPPKQPLALGVQAQLLDAKSGQVKKDLGLARIGVPPQTGNPAVPVGLRLAIAELDPGSYVVRVTALDSMGNQFTRQAPFEVE